MSGIFISYRRSDSLPWAGRLFDGLSRCFGKARVFMDINGGIPRGANFEKVLTEAVAGCDTLLALIGPSWLTCKRADGGRRLDAPDDWVRGEIAACLGRGIPVVPVLFGGTSLPAESELPTDLRPLCKQQKADVADTDWNHHVSLLVQDLVRLTSLELAQPLESDDVDSANSSIRVLSSLLAGNRAVADAVGRSKEVVENTYQRIGRLELFKGVHDALHTLEFECLRPLQASGPAARVRPFKIRFAAEANRIRAAIDGHDINPVLHDDIVDGLEATEAAFQAAIEQPGDAPYARVVGELNKLLSGLPSRLDAGISDAARELSLDRLVELMGTVRGTLDVPPEDGALTGFVQGIDALQRLRDELDQRVQEHTQLQRLDSKLRTVCVGGVAPGTLVSEWGRIKLARARLAPPLSPELQAVLEDLTALEGEIEAKLGAGDEPDTVDLIREYFRVVAGVFRDVDRSLKDFCMRLSAVSQSLKAVLDLC